MVLSDAALVLALEFEAAGPKDSTKTTKIIKRHYQRLVLRS
jgi:hypothetical protein